MSSLTAVMPTSTSMRLLTGTPSAQRDTNMRSLRVSGAAMLTTMWLTGCGPDSAPTAESEGVLPTHAPPASLAPAPVIATSPTSLRFLVYAFRPQYNPPSQTLKITNAGGGKRPGLPATTGTGSSSGRSREPRRRAYRSGWTARLFPLASMGLGRVTCRRQLPSRPSVRRTRR